MAYADVISLKYTIQSLLHSEVGNEVPALSKLYIILHDAVESLQEVLEIVHNPIHEELMGKRDFMEPHMMKRFPLEYSVVRFASRVDVPSLIEFLVHTRVPLDCSDGRIGEAVSSLVALLESLVSKQPDLQIFAGELDRAKLEINSFQETVNTINHEQKMKDAKQQKKKSRKKSLVSGIDPKLKKSLERKMDPELKKSLDHGMELLQTWCSKKSLNHEYPQTMKLLSDNTTRW